MANLQSLRTQRVPAGQGGPAPQDPPIASTWKNSPAPPEIRRAKNSRPDPQFGEQRGGSSQFRRAREVVARDPRRNLRLGPLEPLLKDPTISDILVNRFDRVYVERAGKLEITGLSFKDNQHLMQIIDRIVSRIGRRVDESSPRSMPACRMALVSTASFRPLALDGACLSIRRFGRDPITARNMLENKTLTEPMLELLSAVVKGRLNVIISGGTGAGKRRFSCPFRLHTELGAHRNHRDAAELQLKQEHIVRLEDTPSQHRGQRLGPHAPTRHQQPALRPDRIVVGEVRGEEAFDMLQAMNTGHEGSLTTVHANSPRDAWLASKYGFHGQPEHSRARIRHSDRQRCSRRGPGRASLRRFAQSAHHFRIIGMEGDMIALQDIFVFERTGVDESGKVPASFHSTGLPPHFAERLATAGCRLSPALFESRMEV